ncbi:hypothetical protein D9619_013697 [Psilocybe cf. subviscida]|uniref:Uncharacterized protein n=1 Tax=Psilocybe cf. subviscida TaxID=2480587 RepID=A0A8H5B0Y8_9AGAR|nr:hypothetical protein D9619_013697 [Psilocybe cf. subviscida]
MPLHPRALPARTTGPLANGRWCMRQRIVRVVRVMVFEFGRRVVARVVRRVVVYMQQQRGVCVRVARMGRVRRVGVFLISCVENLPFILSKAAPSDELATFLTRKFLQVQKESFDYTDEDNVEPFFMAIIIYLFSSTMTTNYCPTAAATTSFSALFTLHWVCSLAFHALEKDWAVTSTFDSQLPECRSEPSSLDHHSHPPSHPLESWSLLFITSLPPISRRSEAPF